MYIMYSIPRENDRYSLNLSMFRNKAQYTYSIQYTVYNILYTMYIMHYTIHSIHYIEYNI